MTKSLKEDWEEWKNTDGQPMPKLNHGKWVAITMEIRDNATGITREYQDYTFLEDSETQPSSFIWNSGNDSCDCNRSLFFARAAGDKEDWERKCTSGAYSVRVRNKKNGRVFYSEF